MRSRRTGLAGLLFAGHVFGALLAGCAPDAPAPGPASPAPEAGASAGTSSVPPAGADGLDPAAVCQALAMAMLGHDTETDTGPDQAWRRAAPYLADPLSTLGPQRGDARWATWVAHRARILVRIDQWVGEPLPDEPGVAYRSLLAATTPVGADGWHGPTERHAVHCALVRSGGQWRVADVVVDDLAMALRRAQRSRVAVSPGGPAVRPLGRALRGWGTP